MNNFNITIGQYVKGNSFLHKLDPRLKIVSTIILMVSIFLIPANNINNIYVLLGFLGLFFKYSSTSTGLAYIRLSMSETVSSYSLL